MNEFELKLNDITRKIVASAAELSMFKATLIKLEKEKEYKESSLKEAQEKYNKNEPPTDDCMELFQKKQNNENLRGEYIEKNKIKFNDKINLPIMMPVRNAPEKRVSMYQEEEKGLYRSYGKHAPFAVKKQPPNMRFYKNPGHKNNEKENNQNQI